MSAKKLTIDFGENPYADDVDSSASDIGILNSASKQMVDGERVILIPAANLIASSKNKDVYDIDDLEALAKDILKRGIQQPLIVRMRPDGKYVVVSGHRRLAANQMAVEKYGYKEGECVPCLLRDDIHSELEEREALILDNLQRDKSDFNRMMEIVEMRKCAEERRELGESIENIRLYIMDKLGVSNSEISRFERIHSSLIEPLMQSFRERLISTNVAFQVAKLDENAQFYIHKNWERTKDDGILTFPVMTALIKKYNEGDSSDSESSSDNDAEKEKPVVYETLGFALEKISLQLSALTTTKEAFSELPKPTQNKLLKRINKIQKELTYIFAEIQKDTN